MEKMKEIEEIIKKSNVEMEEIIIKRSDVVNYGKKLIKDIYKYFNDDEEEKVEKNKLEKYLIKFYIEMFVECKYEKYLEKKYICLNMKMKFLIKMNMKNI